ncbi:MAG: UDP-N-acetylmuramate dehydrogenase [Gemmataceae bacterium]|nr:UDP-N-acetylmuramate dehydrogenase [Gemmataceae bacterium]
MAQNTWQPHLQEFAEFIRWNEPLAPYTHLRVGGPADALAQPRSLPELSAVVRRCAERQMPMHVLGSGCNILVQDEGVRGVVLRLSEPAFTQVSARGRRVRAGSGASLSQLISHAARHALAGLETLVGTPGTVGGALRHSAGNRAGDLGQALRLVEAVDATGGAHTREGDELSFAYQAAGLDDAVLVAAEFELEAEEPDAIVKRMRKAWIQRKGHQPFSFQAAARVFRDPRGLSADALIKQSGLAGTRVGGAEVSDPHAGYVVAHQGTTARDVLRLIELVRSRVQERFHVELELEISVW